MAHQQNQPRSRQNSPGRFSGNSSSDRIRQTPGSSTKAPSPKKRPAPNHVAQKPAPRHLSEQERKRKRFEAEQRRKKEAFYRSQRKKVWQARLKLFGVTFLCVLLAGILLFYGYLNFQMPKITHSVTYQIGAEQEDGSNETTVPFRKSFRNGIMYIDFTPIANLCDMIVTGDSSFLRYTAKDNSDETLLFHVGTDVAVMNGLEWKMGGKCYYEDGELFAPYEFISKYTLGLSFTYEHGKVTVLRKYEDESLTAKTAGSKDELQSIRFLLKSTNPLVAIPDEQGTAAALGFLADLSAYENYMNPSDRDQYLLIASKEHLITAAEEPSADQMISIQDVRRDGRANQKMVATAEKALEAMIQDLYANGFTDVTVTQGYQSYAVINYLYNQAKAKGTEADAEYPGASDNETGLSCDMHNMESADVAFGATPAGQWLAQNCWKYGFVLRYPEDKVETTGVSYAPWHFRFVGRYHSIRMNNRGMCLEEYVAYLNETGYFDA